MSKSFDIFLDYFKIIIRRIVSEDFFGIASEVSYMLTIGIFPFILFLTAIFGWIGRKFFIDKILFVLTTLAPDEVSDLLKIVLKDVIFFNQGGFVAIFGFIVVMFLASNAIAAIIKGLNKANGVKETRSFLNVRLLSILMVFVNTFFLFISINLIIFGNFIVELLNNYILIPNSVQNLIFIARWPVSFFFLFVMASVNYYVLPCIDFSQKRKSVVPGAIFFCFFWLLGSWLFSLYVDALGTYNKVYGTLGAFAILMVWLYYTSMVMLIGAEINSHNLDKYLNS